MQTKKLHEKKIINVLNKEGAIETDFIENRFQRTLYECKIHPP